MSGLLTLSPLLGFGPPGWVAWAVGGAALTVATVLAGQAVLSKVQSRTDSDTKAVPITGARKDCPKQRFVVRVQAQGSDCGGTSKSTIGAPALVKTVPVLVVEGLALSAQTWLLLNRTQKEIRTLAKGKADAYISRGPANGGYFGKKTFPATDQRGGKRYDVDCEGSGPSLLG